jgi:hypothetical protein
MTLMTKIITKREDARFTCNILNPCKRISDVWSFRTKRIDVLASAQTSPLLICIQHILSARIYCGCQSEVAIAFYRYGPFLIEAGICIGVVREQTILGWSISN